MRAGRPLPVPPLPAWARTTSGLSREPGPPGSLMSGLQSRGRGDEARAWSPDRWLGGLVALVTGPAPAITEPAQPADDEGVVVVGGRRLEQLVEDLVVASGRELEALTDEGFL